MTSVVQVRRPQKVTGHHVSSESNSHSLNKNSPKSQYSKVSGGVSSLASSANINSRLKALQAFISNKPSLVPNVVDVKNNRQNGSEKSLSDKKSQQDSQQDSRHNEKYQNQKSIDKPNTQKNKSSSSNVHQKSKPINPFYGHVPDVESKVEKSRQLPLNQQKQVSVGVNPYYQNDTFVNFEKSKEMELKQEKETKIQKELEAQRQVEIKKHEELYDSVLDVCDCIEVEKLEHLQSNKTKRSFFSIRKIKEKKSYELRFNKLVKVNNANKILEGDKNGDTTFKVSTGKNKVQKIDRFSQFLSILTDPNSSLNGESKIIFGKDGIEFETSHWFFSHDERHANQRLGIIQMNNMIKQELSDENSFLYKNIDVAKDIVDLLKSNRKIKVSDLTGRAWLTKLNEFNNSDSLNIQKKIENIAPTAPKLNLPDQRNQVSQANESKVCQSDKPSAPPLASMPLISKTQYKEKSDVLGDHVTNEGPISNLNEKEVGRSLNYPALSKKVDGHIPKNPEVLAYAKKRDEYVKKQSVTNLTSKIHKEVKRSTNEKQNPEPVYEVKNEQKIEVDQKPHNQLNANSNQSVINKDQTNHVNIWDQIQRDDSDKNDFLDSDDEEERDQMLSIMECDQLKKLSEKDGRQIMSLDDIPIPLQESEVLEQQEHRNSLLNVGNRAVITTIEKQNQFLKERNLKKFGEFSTVAPQYGTWQRTAYEQIQSVNITAEEFKNTEIGERYFVKKQVSPALYNGTLSELPSVKMNGVDCTSIVQVVAKLAEKPLDDETTYRVLALDPNTGELSSEKMLQETENMSIEDKANMDAQRKKYELATYKLNLMLRYDLTNGNSPVKENKDFVEQVGTSIYQEKYTYLDGVAHLLLEGPEYFKNVLQEFDKLNS